MIGADQALLLRPSSLYRSITSYRLGNGCIVGAYGPHGGDDHGIGHVEQANDLWAKFVDTLSGAISWGGNLDGHLILYVFLPILIFEAGFALDVHTFKKSFLNAFYFNG